jgi:hypothetical protein
MLAEAAMNAPELVGRLGYEPLSYIVGMFHNEPFDLIVEVSSFTFGQCNLVLSLSGPHQSSIEGFRRQVGREKRDGVKAQRFGCRYSGKKMAMIGFLHRCAAGYPDIRPVRLDGRDASSDDIKSSLDASDTIVNLFRTVNRDDYVIEESGDLLGAFGQQQAGGQQGETNLLLTKKVAESAQIAVQQGFAAGQDYLADPEIAERRAMAVQVGDFDLLMRLPLPNVTHDAPAVAVGVDIED